MRAMAQGMRKMLTLAVPVFVTLTVIGGAEAAEVPCMVIVQPGEGIQAAIDEAPPDTVVCLAGGVWEEHLVISRSLTLRGDPQGSTIRGYLSDVPVVQVHTPEEEQVVVSVVGLHLTEGSGRDGHGLLVEGTAQVTIADCTVTDTTMGIVALESAQAVIDRCVVERNHLGGIVAAHEARVTITQCTLSDNTAAGVVLEHDVHAVLEDNEILLSTMWEDRFGFGIMLVEPPCYGDHPFRGYVTGQGNRIPGPDMPDGNLTAPFCPDVLGFLTSDEGGELVR